MMTPTPTVQQIGGALAEDTLSQIQRLQQSGYRKAAATGSPEIKSPKTVKGNSLSH